MGGRGGGGGGSLSPPRLNIFTVGSMGVMICLGQGGLRSLSASSYYYSNININNPLHPNVYIFYESPLVPLRPGKSLRKFGLVNLRILNKESENFALSHQFVWIVLNHSVKVFARVFIL